MKIVVCGCSFSATVAELPGTHWSEHLASMMGAELTNFARQGISNAAIRVQIDEAIKLKPDWVFVGATTEDRIEFPVVPFRKIDDGHPNHTAYDGNRSGYRKELGIKNFNYGDKHPYTVVSETMFSIIDKLPQNYRVGQVSADVQMAVSQYAAFIYDAHWKKQCDRWILNSGLWALHEAKIPFLFNPWINAEPKDFDMPDWFIKKYYVDWPLGFGRLCSEFPFSGSDPGYHTSAEGQAELAKRYYEYVKRKDNENTNG